MSSPTGCYRRTPGLRVRAVPEANTCIVFTPDSPKLYTLNPNAWLILELCDGCSDVELESLYVDAVVPPLQPAEASRHLADGLTLLTANGIIERAA